MPWQNPGKREHWEMIPATAISMKDKTQTAPKAKLLQWRGDLLCAVPALWVWCLCGFCSAQLLCPKDFQVLVSQKWDPAECCDLFVSQTHTGPLCLEGDLTPWLPTTPILSFKPALGCAPRDAAASSSGALPAAHTPWTFPRVE